MSELNLIDTNFQSEIEEAKGLALVDFWAPWCGPCQIMGPVIEEIAGELKDQVKIAKVNVDENPKTSNKYSVMSIPTLIFYKDGKEVERLVGAHDKETILQKIDELK
jgi:thioredoxin 1